MSKELLPIFNTLPEDNFGVLVENEKDKKRLLWLVNQIGETKLRKSAEKRNKYYPDSLLFVSTILKRFHLTVPPSVYTGVNDPIYRVYVLVLRDHSVCKIGMTGDWPNRAYSFVKTADYTKDFDQDLINLFDTKLSLAFDAESKKKAAQIELEIKKTFTHAKAPSPYKRGLINYGCGGHKEWFYYTIYDDIVNHLAFLGDGISLHSSLSWKDLIVEADLPNHRI